MNCRKRFDFASYVRCLADNVWEDVDTDDEEDETAEDNEEMDVDKVQLRKPGRNYRNQVMRALKHKLTDVIQKWLFSLWFYILYLLERNTSAVTFIIYITCLWAGSQEDNV